MPDKERNVIPGNICIKIYHLLNILWYQRINLEHECA